MSNSYTVCKFCGEDTAYKTIDICKDCLSLEYERTSDISTMVLGTSILLTPIVIVIFYIIQSL